MAIFKVFKAEIILQKMKNTFVHLPLEFWKISRRIYLNMYDNKKKLQTQLTLPGVWKRGTLESRRPLQTL
jgi:hypothetical protein